MAPKPKRCKVCTINDFKYRCSGCRIEYCSVACYKKHKETCEIVSSSSSSSAVQAPPPAAATGTNAATETPQPQLPVDSEQTQGTPNDNSEDPPLPENPPLRPLTSLKWPYIPDESSYPDPLKRDEPKTLQLHQYESIATSSTIRKVLKSHPNLPTLLTSIDNLRGPDRDFALQRALGVTANDLTDLSRPTELTDDILALRALAEAVEGAVRGDNRGALGLDWGE